MKLEEYYPVEEKDLEKEVLLLLSWWVLRGQRELLALLKPSFVDSDDLDFLARDAGALECRRLVGWCSGGWMGIGKVVRSYLLENGRAWQPSPLLVFSRRMVDWMLDPVLELGGGRVGFGGGATFSMSDLIAGCGSAPWRTSWSSELYLQTNTR